jgi:hypothetical protein
MIAALPGAGGFTTIAADIQAAAPAIILIALLTGAALYLLPFSAAKKVGRGLFAGAAVFIFVTSGLAMAWIDYLVNAFGAGA